MEERFPALDIKAVAMHITKAWMDAYVRALRDVRDGLPPPAPVVDQVMQSVVLALQSYDEGRTRHIAFLKEELIKVITHTPRPIFIERPAEGGAQPPDGGGASNA